MFPSFHISFPVFSDDFRIFCGDLGNEVNDDILARAFGRYPSFLKAKVIRDKRTGKTKGYGFVSFKDPNDYVRADPTGGPFHAGSSSPGAALTMVPWVGGTVHDGSCSLAGAILIPHQ
uniref:RRM domain-containing protein n=1 Tax=Amazona collaria TaxID=241587 RepID=A0A8B9FV27_9PSIT